jgi:hypothetical protein
MMKVSNVFSWRPASDTVNVGISGAGLSWVALVVSGSRGLILIAPCMYAGGAV